MTVPAWPAGPDSPGGRLRLRPHQESAVEALAGTLANGGRAQAVMAMGTGKTLVGRAAAERLLPDGGTVAVLVPSLALVSQTLRAWRAAGGVGDVLAVCSADDPGEAGARGEDSRPATPQGVLEDGQETRATTDPSVIADWLAVSRPGTRLLLATYHSVPRIAAAFAYGDGLAPLDLVIFDEAHRAAADPAAPFATALHDDRAPAARRLFLTATPRLQVGDPDDPRGDEVFPGMSDESLFGPRVYELGVAEAIGRGLLSDYRVVVVGVTDAQVHKLVMDNAPLTVGPKRADAHTIAVQIALAQAARAYDLRRVLVFHNRIASSREFAAVLPHTVDELPAGLGPDGYLTVHHVDAGSSAAERAQALADLAAPEAAGWSVVTNVRVLSEGVDCPALDAVVFADPREGQTSTVQAIGRALRLHPERDQPAVILIPVYLAPGENGDLVAEDSDFRSVWQILRALRDHDGNVGAQLVAARRDLALRGAGDPRPVLPDWLGLHLPSEVGDAFLTAFSARLLNGTTHLHEHGLGRLQAFVERYGHACPGQHYIDETGFRLGLWTSLRRRDQARGILDPGLAAELEALPGWAWNVKETHLDRMMAALRAYAVEHGHARPPVQYRSSDGAPLGTWTQTQRRRYREGRLDPQRIEALERIPGWSWQTGKDERWEDGVEHLRAFSRKFGHSDVRGRDRTPDGYELGNWVIHQRMYRDQLPPERARALEAVPGWGWTRSDAYQERMLAEVARYLAEHGPGPVPVDYRPGHDPGFPVGRWVERQVHDYNGGRMAPELAARLEAIPGFVWGRNDAVHKEILRRLAHYAAEYGTAGPAAKFVTDDGYPLGREVVRLRRRHRQGLLPANRIRDLERLPGWTWEGSRPSRADSEPERFANAVSALRAYAGEHGTCAIPPDVRLPDGRDLGSWVHKQREAYRRGRLTEDQIADLETVPGWYWDRREHLWEQGLTRIRAYAAEHDTADVPREYVTGDGFKLGSWVIQRRIDNRAGRLSPSRAAALEALPGWRWGSRMVRSATV